MAINLEPSLQIKLLGTQVTNFDETNSFTLDNKDEYTFEIQSTSSPVLIALNKVPNTKLIFVHATGDFSLNFTTALGTFTILCTGNFVLNTSQSFITSLVSLTVTTTSTNLIKVYFNIYGKEPTA